MIVQEIQQQARLLGFDDVGITSATIPEEDVRAYKEWLADGYHAELHYMENDLRCHPDKLLPGARTAIIFITYYKQPENSHQDKRIATYAHGRDYHNVHRKRLKKFIKWLEEYSGEEGCAKGFSDSTPILEKALAVQAGLGWFGKNTLLIHRKFGTFTLLSGVLTTLDIPPTLLSLRQPRCGACTRCLDSCPTGALTPYRLDASLCLSYHTIESKKPIPEEIQKKNPGYLFGCDICQNVCPHNMRKPVSEAPDFSPHSGLGPFLDSEALNTIKQQPEKLYGTPLQRRGVKGLLYTASTL